MEKWNRQFTRRAAAVIAHCVISSAVLQEGALCAEYQCF
jgi:hypothetical protein